MGASEPRDATAATDRGGAPGRSNAVKAVVSGVLTVGTLVVVFGVLFPKFADYSDAWAAIRAMSAGALLVLLGATGLNLLVYVWPFPAALPTLRYRPSFMVRQTGFAISNGIPGIGGAVSLGVQYRMLADYGVAAGPAASVIAVTSTWNTLITLALPALGVVAFVISGTVTAREVVLALIAVAVVAVVVWLLALVVRQESAAERLGRIVERAAGWALRAVRRPRDVDVVGPLLRFRASIVDVVSGRWVLITVANLAMQLSSWLVLFVGLRAIQAGDSSAVTWSESLAAFAFARIATFVPLTPGGLGTVDLALTALLAAFGATDEQALAAVLVWRAGTYFPLMLTGLATFLGWRVQQRRRRHHPEREAAADPDR